MKENKKFIAAEKNPSFPDIERQILSFWKQDKIFEKSIHNRQTAPPYTFYDGPPFATGLPHFGHFIASLLKDVFPRYKTMKGYYVERRFGWDTHGLPVENEMERILKLNGKKEINQFGVEEFNENCRSIVLKYTREWEYTIERLGRWVDFQNSYKTMDLSFMESVWWVFKTLYERDLVYKGFYILPYSPRLATPLSNFEVNLGEYREVWDPAITVKVPLEDQEKTYCLIWTTTPWTLPSNLAIGVNPDLIYVKIYDHKTQEYYILAEKTLVRYYTSSQDYEIKNRWQGKDLSQWAYTPVFSFFQEQKNQGAFRLFLANFVSEDSGTGLVHMAPGFGEDDYNVLKNTGITIVCPVDESCHFTSDVSDWAGLFVKKADPLIIHHLSERQLIFKSERYLHRYPFCYRTKEPLIYRAVSSWFIRVEAHKDKLIALNDKINWKPEHLKKGRFGHWLHNAIDWAISRNRFWGNPIPIWESQDSHDRICIGSLAELEKYSGEKINDLHKHYVDKIIFHHKGHEFHRIPEVFDCWFESGSMPYAQRHYPFQKADDFKNIFPADFIAEGLDQTRGWFYTLLVLSQALFDEIPFRNVIVNGLVLASDGKKMSKSERNYTDPLEVLEKLGADALRLYLLSSPIVYGEDLKYEDAKVTEMIKIFIIPLWNAYSFFVMYAEIDNIDPQEIETDYQAMLAGKISFSLTIDQWILSQTENLVRHINQSMDVYEVHNTLKYLQQFIQELNNWYIRRNRRRFWKSSFDEDKQAAYRVLYFVLSRFILLAAPFIPFITEKIYQGLKLSRSFSSIHLDDFPQYIPSYRQEKLEKKMALAQSIVSLGHSLRHIHQIKNRQILRCVYVISHNLQVYQEIASMESLIKEELNVQYLEFSSEEAQFVHYSLTPNFPILGKKLTQFIPFIQKELKKISHEQIQQWLEGNDLKISLPDGQLYAILKEDVLIKRTESSHLKIANDNELTVALDIELDEGLIEEGIMREFIHLMQNLRKQYDFLLTDRINIYLNLPPVLKKIWEKYWIYIQKELLIDKYLFSSHAQQENIVFQGSTIYVFMEKN